LKTIALAATAFGADLAGPEALSSSMGRAQAATEKSLKILKSCSPAAPIKGRFSRRRSAQSCPASTSKL
jgi:hypothetical protein